MQDQFNKVLFPWIQYKDSEELIKQEWDKFPIHNPMIDINDLIGIYNMNNNITYMNVIYIIN